MALLLKDAAKGFGTAKTVIATANDCVSFVFGPDHTTGMKFTLDQWNEIIQFVESQLGASGDREAEKQPSWGPDWSRVPLQYNYFAIDANGLGNVYGEKPQIGTYADEWIGGGCIYKTWKQFNTPLPVDWKESLCKRPIGFPEHVNCKCGF